MTHGGMRSLDLNDIGAVPKTPIAIFRYLIAILRRLDGISLSYHVAPPFSSMTNRVPVAVFASRRAFSSRNSSPEALKTVGFFHDMVLSRGESITYADISGMVKNVDAQLITRINDKLRQIGIIDELIVPCYGHHDIKGCLCYSFPYSVSDLDPRTRQFIEGISHIAHQYLVTAYFARIKSGKNQLSKREFEIIGWIASSKSSTDIATIMNISVASVETYIKRIFKKLSVNNRMSAVLAVLASGQLHT